MLNQNTEALSVPISIYAVPEPFFHVPVVIYPVSSPCKLPSKYVSFAVDAVEETVIDSRHEI